jgi:hypothetical protein
VDGKRQDVGIIGEYERRSVALMHVQINDGGALEPVFFTQYENRYGKVVKYAKACAFRSKRVMRTARQIAAEAGTDRLPAGRKRSANRRERPLDQALRPRKSNAPQSALRKRAVEKRSDVDGIMYALDRLNLREWRRMQVIIAVCCEQSA